MTRRTAQIVSSAERAVSRLVSESHKQGSLYAQNPKLVAQVSRTGKWLLKALAALRQTLDPNAKEIHS